MGARVNSARILPIAITSCDDTPISSCVADMSLR